MTCVLRHVCRRTSDKQHRFRPKLPAAGSQQRRPATRHSTNPGTIDSSIAVHTKGDHPEAKCHTSRIPSARRLIGRTSLKVRRQHDSPALRACSKCLPHHRNAWPNKGADQLHVRSRKTQQRQGHPDRRRDGTFHFHRHGSSGKAYQSKHLGKMASMWGLPRAHANATYRREAERVMPDMRRCGVL